MGEKWSIFLLCLFIEIVIYSVTKLTVLIIRGCRKTCLSHFIDSFILDGIELLIELSLHLLFFESQHLDVKLIVSHFFLQVSLSNSDIIQIVDELIILQPSFLYVDFGFGLILSCSGLKSHISLIHVLKLALHFLNNVILFMVCSEEGTQANELTLWVYEKCDDDLTNRVGIFVSLGQELILFGCLYLMFFWNRSPYYIEPLNRETKAPKSLSKE